MVDQPWLADRRYRLDRCIGEGGMGKVWKAYDEVLQRDVAIKEVIFPSQISDEDRRQAVERSLREARAAAQLDHPAVVTVHDVIEHDGRPWIVMELVPGGSLADVIEANGPLPPQQVAQIGMRVLEGLSAAHARGVLHRDIKPSNVLVQGSRVVLADFGAATRQGDPRLTGTGMVIGTPAYLAPERACGREAQAESDLWSLGATLYAAVEGRPPHDGDNPMAMLYAVMTSEPRRPQRAGPLAPVLMELLHRHPEQRPSAERAIAMLALVAGLGSPLERPIASAAGQPIATSEPTHPATLTADSRNSALSDHMDELTVRDSFTRGMPAARRAYSPAVSEDRRYRQDTPIRSRERLIPADRGHSGEIDGGIVASIVIVFLLGFTYHWLWAAIPGIGVILIIHRVIRRIRR